MPCSDFIPRMGKVTDDGTTTFGRPVRKRIIITCCAIFILFIVVLVAMIYGKYGNGERNSLELLQVKYVPLRNAMDLTIDPCDDFYNFTCGNWAKNDVIDEGIENMNTFELLKNSVDMRKRYIFQNSTPRQSLPRVVNDAINFYDYCINSRNSIVAVKHYVTQFFIDAISGFPVLAGKYWNSTNFKYVKAVAYLQMFGVETIFKLYSLADDYNTTNNIFFIKPSSKDMPFELYHTMFFVAITQLSERTLTDEEMTEAVDSITRAEKKIPTIDHLKANQTRLSLKALNSKTPGFDWVEYFQYATADFQTMINEDTIILVENLSYFEELIANFFQSNLSPQDMANFFGWSIIQEVFQLIPGAFEEYSSMLGYEEDEFHTVLTKSCFDVIEAIYYCAVDYLYIQHELPSKVKDGKTIMQYLKDALKELILSSNFDISTRNHALTKLEAMSSVIGFKEYLLNKATFDVAYETFPNFSSNLLETFFRLNKYFFTVMIQQVIYSHSRLESPRSVYFVGAYYNLQANNFTIPLGIFNKPFYYQQEPWYLNFGSLGYIIGHEIMHAFDTKGRHRDSTGTIADWWSVDANKEYNLKVQCILNHFASFHQLNASESKISEDIADVEGLRIAHLAYNRWVDKNQPEKNYVINEKTFTPEQMFFIAFGNSICEKPSTEMKYVSHSIYSSRELRVMAAVSNSAAFAKAFRCSKGSKMNPEKKCAIW